jgi:hypothetical protein
MFGLMEYPDGYGVGPVPSKPARKVQRFLDLHGRN